MTKLFYTLDISSYVHIFLEDLYEESHPFEFQYIFIYVINDL